MISKIFTCHSSPLVIVREAGLAQDQHGGREEEDGEKRGPFTAGRFRFGDADDGARRQHGMGVGGGQGSRRAPYSAAAAAGGAASAPVAVATAATVRSSARRVAAKPGPGSIRASSM